MIAVIQVRKYRQLKKAYHAQNEGQCVTAPTAITGDSPHRTPVGA